MKKPTLVFLGSFQHYSTKVLQAIIESDATHVLTVVTTPPIPMGRKKILTQNPTQTYAESVHIPVLTPISLDNISPMHVHTSYVTPPDLFVVSGYGKLLPKKWLDYPTIAPLNLHFSLLPKYRGANPAEWAILMGERKTGVTLIKMDAGVDTGPILMQESLPITPEDTRETLYERLYDLAGKMIVKFLHSQFPARNALPEAAAPLQAGTHSVAGGSILHSAKPQPQQSPTPYARRFTRPDGFIPWTVINKAMSGVPIATKELPPFLSSLSPSGYTLYPALIERATRALSGFPGLWTTINTPKGEKRLKILSVHLEPATDYQLPTTKLVLDQVHLEGLQPSTFAQIKNQIYSS